VRSLALDEAAAPVKKMTTRSHIWASQANYAAVMFHGSEAFFVCSPVVDHVSGYACAHECPGLNEFSLVIILVFSPIQRVLAIRVFVNACRAKVFSQGPFVFHD
jgi:hypothetical protein